MTAAHAVPAEPEPPLTRRRLRELAGVTAGPEIADDGSAEFEAPLKVAADTERLVTTPIRVVGPAAEAESPDAPAPQPEGAESAGVRDRADDAFAAAARALNFTGETPVIRSAEPAAPLPSRAAGHTAPRRRRGSAFRRFAAATASISAMGFVGLLAIGMTTPVGALAQGTGSSSATTASADGQQLDDGEIQAFVASSDVQNADIERSQGYEAESFAQIASADGISTSGAFFTNDPTADIQWPFAVGTSMSSGYGMRWGQLHEGIDFTPGDGAPVQAITDGVVRIATEAGGNYGVTVYIDHVIDGQVVTSHYAHMQYGSLQVVAGQRVETGDVIGLVGNTGRSYGAHMHFEIIINGSTTDPLPWLEEYANRHYTDEESAEVDASITQLLGDEITID